MGRKKVEECFARIESRLEGKDWAVGEVLIVVDIYLYLFWQWGNALGKDMANRYTAYGDVLRKVECLYGVRKAMRENGLEACFEGKQIVHGDYMEFVVNTLTNLPIDSLKA